MLETLLKNEEVRRQTEANIKADIAREAAEIVGKIHDLFKQSIPQMETLNLIGDYGRPIAAKERQLGKSIEKCMTNCGLELRLGSTITPAELVVSVSPRVPGKSEAAITVYERRHYPFDSGPKTDFNGHAPAEEVMKVFFSLLMPRVHMGDDK